MVNFLFSSRTNVMPQNEGEREKPSDFQPLLETLSTVFISVMLLVIGMMLKCPVEIMRG